MASTIHSLEIIATTNWCAIQVRPRSEKSVLALLESKGYELFLPVYRKRTQWSDRAREIEVPLFPGYIFCRADLAGKPHLIGTPGVIGILSFGRKIAVISNSEIQSLKTVIDSRLAVAPWPFLLNGQRVRITNGVLANTEGILIRTKSNCRLVLSVEALCRSIIVEVDRDAILPLSSRIAPQQGAEEQLFQNKKVHHE